MSQWKKSQWTSEDLFLPPTGRCFLHGLPLTSQSWIPPAVQSMLPWAMRLGRSSIAWAYGWSLWSPGGLPHVELHHTRSNSQPQSALRINLSHKSSRATGELHTDCKTGESAQTLDTAFSLSEPKISHRDPAGRSQNIIVPISLSPLFPKQCLSSYSRTSPRYHGSWTLQSKNFQKKIFDGQHQNIQHLWGVRDQFLLTTVPNPLFCGPGPPWFALYPSDTDCWFFFELVGTNCNSL